jgi:hypothetical protein
VKVKEMIVFIVDFLIKACLLYNIYYGSKLSLILLLAWLMLENIFVLTVFNKEIGTKLNTFTKDHFGL